MDCGPLDSPSNGTVAFDDTIENSTATYTCDSGHNLVGPATRTCAMNGSWTETEPTCKRKWLSKLWSIAGNCRATYGVVAAEAVTILLYQPVWLVLTIIHCAY